MHSAPEQFQAHYDAYVDWQTAGVTYWAMIEDLRQQRSVGQRRKDRVLREFADPHNVWMRAGESLSSPRKE